MRGHPGKEFGLWLDHSGNVINFADDTAWLYEYGVDSLSEAQKKDSEPREPSEDLKKKHFCQQCGMQIAPTSMSCAACGWERPSANTVQMIQGELVDVDISAKGAFQPRKGLRAECLKDPRAIWNASFCYCQANTRRGREFAQKWAYRTWKTIYPTSKLPRGLYDGPFQPGDVTVEQYGLIEREISKARKAKRKSTETPGAPA
jgi:hypothetical protein